MTRDPGSPESGTVVGNQTFIAAAGLDGRLNPTVVLRGFKDTLPCICRWVCRLSTPPFEFSKTRVRVSHRTDRAGVEDTVFTLFVPKLKVYVT